MVPITGQSWTKDTCNYFTDTIIVALHYCCSAIILKALVIIWEPRHSEKYQAQLQYGGMEPLQTVAYHLVYL